MEDAPADPTVRWAAVLTKLLAGENLSRSEAHDVVATVLSGTATDAQIAGYLIGLAAKGETTEEILGMRDAMLAASTPLELPPETIDIVGVGGAARRRIAAFNVSTIASFVAAGAGATVCKHGNRKASSTSGSFDLLEALGVNIEAPARVVEAGVEAIGLGFAFARAHHPSMRHVGPARAQLGVPSVFNVLGPLAHPGRLRRQVLGVPDRRRARQMADVVAGTDAELVWVVHGHGDLDELTVTGSSRVIEVRNGACREFEIAPGDFGLGPVDDAAIEGGDVDANVRLARSVFAGEPSPNADMVVLNAAAGLVVAGVAPDLAEGVAAARQAIDRGDAASKLVALVAHTAE